jgi:hypothetical protein
MPRAAIAPRGKQQAPKAPHHVHLRRRTRRLPECEHHIATPTYIHTCMLHKLPHQPVRVCYAYMEKPVVSRVSHISTMRAYRLCIPIYAV